MSKVAPGVGAYDIQQGEKLTFQQGPSYSFGLTGDEKSSVGRTASGAALPQASTGKPGARSTLRQRMKSSLAFVPPILLQAEDNRQSADSRVHAASQYDDSHLRVSRNDELLDDLPPHYGEGDEALAEEPEEVEQTVETEMDRALRLQQRLFMSEFVQQVVSNQDIPSHFVPRTKHSTDHTRRPTKSEPYWATSEVSPGIERLLHRQRRAPSKSRTSSGSVPAFRPSKRVVKKSPPSPPPRRQLDNDQHLAWAARISELYQAPAAEQS
ncbi:uncharacterized protein KRP23_7218 [Phytophthora ramorum]|uniref:uncharacterized protein n=1 Tax=Phytophthora ramorum TaxID=164328 RepID=UPI0030ABF68A|nr:hypothetical protein KRP23_7218 [Phytophthora ramorum]